ncbi:hypothetical protein [Nitrososphaera sp. AFS]|uniref:hypothetical protein n=1 Tax=Nitrososphaera sp. AFS TaxID=2301191 RepID=UPI0013923E50|nr:hypothetical protein [Nitrososphaera sp. AFS]
MSNGDYAILASVLILAIVAGISSFAANIAFADTCTEVPIHVLIQIFSQVVAASSGTT